MTQKEISELTDQELMEAVRKNKPSPMVDAFFIGFFIGIIIYSVVQNTWGLVTLIPLIFIYGLLKKPKRTESLKNELKARGL